ncbi:MAG TPA: hypothetical protein DEQ47_08110 [Solibacterales bacterium]|nr:hypothetical protein [Bryobacterales bacterium]
MTSTLAFITFAFMVDIPGKYPLRRSILVRRFKPECGLADNKYCGIFADAKSAYLAVGAKRNALAGSVVYGMISSFRWSEVRFFHLSQRFIAASNKRKLLIKYFGSAEIQHHRQKLF